MSIGEVAEAFGVEVAAVRGWADNGRLKAIRTPGNQRRFLRAEIEAILAPVGGIETKAAEGSDAA